MRGFLFILTFLTFTLNVNCQENDIPKNSLFIEALGNTESYLSLNYERFFSSSENNVLRWNFRVGYGFQRMRYDTSYHHSIATEFNMLIGNQMHFAEIGIGFVPTFNNSSLTSVGIAEFEKSNYYYHYTLRFGYKLIAEGNIFMKFSVIPTLRPVTPGSSSLFYNTSFGFSLGYSW